MANHQLLTREDHQELRIRIEPDAARGDGEMAAYIVPAEFRRVQSEFPIVFRRNQADDSFGALALFGFENGENLFLDGNVWHARYRPLSLAVQPFLIGPPVEEGSDGQVHVDLDHARISQTGEGMRVFDEDGGTTPYLEQIAGMLGELHAGHTDARGFFAALERHGLLEPFTLEVPLSNGSKQSLVGFHIIAEERLQSLDGDALGELHAAGYLLPIFMALASLSHFSTLVERKDASLKDV